LVGTLHIFTLVDFREIIIPKCHRVRTPIIRG
jgi:hypothetical protein